jgi:predicted metalloprotease with PDZ domain
MLLSYTLRIDPESLQKRMAHVEAQVSGSSSFSISFATYAWFGETYLEIPISNVNATDEKGTPLKISLSRSQQDWGVKRVWSITRGSATLVLFKYDISFEYYIERIQSYSGYIASDYALGVGAFTFLVPSNFSPDQIEVRFDLPASWTSVSPWEYVEDHYDVASIDELATATFGLGNLEVFHRVIWGTNLTIATYRPWGDFAGEQIAEFSFTAFEYVANLFGTSPRKRYVAVYCPPAKDGKDISGWAESSGSQGISVWGGWGLQEGTGWKRPFLHRVIHIWNTFPPYAMQAKTTSPDWTNWFLEGSTDYYAWDKALIHLGVLSNHRVLADFFETYVSQYLGTRYDVAVAEAYNFVNNPERYFFLMYQKGALICFLLDSLLQRITAEKVSFDDVMRLLYEKFGNMRGVYTNRDIQSIAQQLSDQDLSVFFNNYVYGKTKLPLMLQGSDLGIDWPEFLRTVKLSGITIALTTTTTPSPVTETVASESTLETFLQTTTTLESETTRATSPRLATGVFTTEVSVIVGLAFVVLAIGVFYLRRRWK